MNPTLPLWYRLASALAGPLLRIVAANRHRAMGCAAERAQERVGIATKPRPVGPLVWVQAASLGELQSVVPILSDLHHKRPDLHILITTTTRSGGDLATKLGASLPVTHQFSPLDLRCPITKFIAHWRPDLVIWVENEMMPRAAALVQSAGSPQIAVNLRRSKTRDRVPGLVRATLGRCAAVSAKDQATFDGLRKLGLPDKNLMGPGDLKAGADPLPFDAKALKSLQDSLGDRPRWLACSVHPEDDECVLQAQQSLTDETPTPLLILIPRHIDRGDALAATITAAGLTLARRSAEETPDKPTQVYLADTFGETGLFFRLCNVTLLGGGFGTRGGHNPWEPAILGNHVLFGPDIANAREAFVTLEGAGVATEIIDAAGIVAGVREHIVGDNQAATDTLTATGQAVRTALVRAILANLPDD